MSAVEAMQTSLAAEHAAVYVHGVLGGQVSRSSDPALADAVEAAYRVHRGRRDQLIRLLRDAGAEPVASEVAYVLPSRVDTAARISAAAREVERRCATTYADQVGRTAAGQRRWAVTALGDAAARQLRFRGSPETFPGAEELADR
ncbi:ferritin-like domain-containing protein [Nocardioides donggukensis]|uniref:Ferritin-like domain-containing protein n=1 Tax=Nocardioides donggukensis TaxID=2774019 RepID=A0A927K4Z9_9ACTN|nr:ferritin-like domain-containing protein [Nocardioides donggukensis]MBD8869078.1 ferritin-like domain-containing protein [Nocardioides donggukensis]